LSSVGIASSYGLDGQCSIPGRARIVYLVHRVQIDSGAHLVTYTRIPGSPSPGVKQRKREADHSRPSSVEVKNGGIISPFPDTLSWRGA
jgi:hypothetical protein